MQFGLEIPSAALKQQQAREQERIGINPALVGALPVRADDGSWTVRFGLYLPGILSKDGFIVRVRIIHREDRFKPEVPPQDIDLQYDGSSPLGLWSATVPITNQQGSFGGEGTYLYRYQLLWRSPRDQGEPLVLTQWFTDPFAAATDIGRLSAFTLDSEGRPFAWTDADYRTPDLDDLVIYELQVEEFNDTFAGVIDRLDYLESLGVNCLELMPVMSSKLDFDWGYGPLHYFAPSARFGGPDGLKQLVNAAHKRGIAVILDVVYEHVDPMFAYFRVYEDAKQMKADLVSPMIRGGNKYGFGPATDFTSDFTNNYLLLANRNWLDEYHVDGFRYDEVTDWYDDPARAAGFKKLTEGTYRHTLGIPRFQKEAGGYSRVIQVAEALYRAHLVLGDDSYSNGAWQDDLLNKAADMIRWNYASADFAQLLDPYFCQYPKTKTVPNAAGQPVEMPVAPIQYLETHDHDPLIVAAGVESDPGPLPEGRRDRFYLVQPYVIALYTCQGVPMLWQGQELADNYNLPDNGLARVHLRRDTHWEYFYDVNGGALIRLFRRLGYLRRTCRGLRSRESYFYYQQSLQGNQIMAYRRHAPAVGDQKEETAMVFINFSDQDGSIQVPFPQAGTWQEMIDQQATVSVSAEGAVQNVPVPSHYGAVYLLQN